MSTPLHTIVEGWTEPLDTQLLRNSAAWDATLWSVEAIVRDRHGQLVTVPCTWASAANAQARLSLSAGLLLAAKSPYTLRFKVTDGSGQVTYHPNEAHAPAVIEVGAA